MGKYKHLLLYGRCELVYIIKDNQTSNPKLSAA